MLAILVACNLLLLCRRDPLRGRVDDHAFLLYMIPQLDHKCLARHQPTDR